MDINKKLKEPYVFPSGILAQVRENAMGGYVLFTINEEGAPVAAFNFENNVSTLALLKHIELWTNGMNQVIFQGAFGGEKEDA